MATNTVICEFKCSVALYCKQHMLAHTIHAFCKLHIAETSMLLAGDEDAREWSLAKIQ